LLDGAWSIKRSGTGTDIKYWNGRQLNWNLWCVLHSSSCQCQHFGYIYLRH